MVLSSLGLDWLVALALPTDSKGYEAVALVLQIFLIGGAIVIAAAGALTAVVDVIKLTWAYIRGGN